MKPMLACKTPSNLETLKFPLYASPKLDGVRCLVTEDGAMSRSMKPIRNKYVQALLRNPKYVGLDGELIVGSLTAEDVYRQTTSGVMSGEGQPEFIYYVFDLWDYGQVGFSERLAALKAMSNDSLLQYPVQLHQHVLIETLAGLERYEQKCLAEGYEGVVTRSLSASYKFGRSTAKEQGMVKLKRFFDAEAKIIGFEELLHNDNEATKNELGYTQRSAHKDNKVPMGVLGALVCRTPEGVEFNIGTGFDAKDRANFWMIREALEGKWVKYKSFGVGVKDKPRHPVFLGFRDQRDM